MMKAILLIWIGYGNTQVLSTDRFETMEECHAAAAALAQHDQRLAAKCIPYSTETHPAPLVPRSR
jgi:hypothetical protein